MDWELYDQEAQAAAKARALAKYKIAFAEYIDSLRGYLNERSVEERREFAKWIAVADEKLQQAEQNLKRYQ